MLSLQLFVLFLLVFGGFSTSLEEFEASGQEDNEVSTLASPFLTLAPKVVSYRYIYSAKKAPSFDLFKPLDKKLEKVEAVNRVLEQNYSMTFGQLDQFLNSNYSINAIYLYAVHVYPKVFERLVQNKLDKWTEVKNTPNTTIDPSIFIDNPFMLIGETLGLMFIDIMDVFTPNFSLSLKIPMHMCSFILRRTNETDLANELDAPIEDPKSPESEKQQDLFSKALKDKKCPNLPVSYMTSLKIASFKVKELVQNLRNYTISPCMSLASKTIHDELSRLRNETKDNVIDSKSSEEDGDEKSKIDSDPIEVLGDISAFIVNALHFAQHLDTKREVTEAELDAALHFFRWIGYPLVTRIQQVFIALVAEYKEKALSLDDMDAIMHFFAEDSVAEVSKLSAEMFETEKEEKFGNGTQDEMKKLLSKIALPPIGPQLKTSKLENGTYNFTIIDSLGQNHTLLFPEFNFGFLQEILQTQVAAVEAEEIADQSNSTEVETSRTKREHALFDTVSLEQERIIRQAFEDPKLQDVPPYKLKDVLNCTFEPDSSSLNDSDAIPVNCSFNLAPILNAYNVSFDDYLDFLSSSKGQVVAINLVTLSFVAMTFDEVLSEEYERVVHQVQGTEIEQPRPFNRTAIKSGTPVENADFENVNSTWSAGQELGVDQIYFVPSIFEIGSRIMKGQYEMPDFDSYEPVRRRLAYNKLKKIHKCLSTPVRFIYANIRTSLLHESEKSKLEIFRQVNQHLKCSARSALQRVYHKGVQLVDPSVPGREFKCEMPNIIVVQ